MAWYYKGRLIRVGRGWTDDKGIKHPTNWISWNINDKTNAGLAWVPDKVEEPYDSRFYINANTPKPLVDKTNSNGDVTEGLKTISIRQAKQTANQLLQPTDWMIVRAAETGEQPSSEVMAYRAAVRQACGEIEQAITQCVNLDEFKNLYVDTRDIEGNLVEQAVINSWPEPL